MLRHVESRNPLKVFISYCRADERFREELARALSPLVVAREIAVLQDSDIRAGTQWNDEILKLLEEADVVLTLVSPAFFHSNFVVTVEMPKALERANSGQILLVPVVVRPVEWRSTSLAEFQALPRNLTPVSKWDDRDDAYKEIAAGLREAIEEYRRRRLEEPIPVEPLNGPRVRPEQPMPGRNGAAAGEGVADQSVLQGPVSVIRRRLEPSNSYDFNRRATVFFRGRSEELERLCNDIRRGQSAVVFGMQRVGKTSLVERAIEMVSSEPEKIIPITIRIDMFSQWGAFKSALEFFAVIVKELALAEGNDPGSLERLLLDAYNSSVLQEFNLQDTFSSILKKSKKITERPILLFVDEFQEVQHVFDRPERHHAPMAFDAGLIRWLGSLIKRGEFQMVLGCRFQAKDLEQRERLQLFKLLDHIELGPLDEASARSLIRDPVADSIRYDEEAVRRIVDLTGRFPYLIQYLGHELVNRQRVLRTGQVRRKDVEDCADEIVTSQLNESRLSVFYEDFKVLDGGYPWKAILALAILAKAEHQLVGFNDITSVCKDRAGLPDRERVRELLSFLALTKVVVEEKRGPEPSYYFGPELLRRWLREQGHTRTLR
jgi:AAA+ ATPase superfamily predicted ATPase